MSYNISDRLAGKLKSPLIIIGYLIFMIVMAVLFNKYIDRDVLQSMVINTGLVGIFLYLLVEIIYVTFTPLLNTFILIFSGYIFGGNLGFVINFIATTVGLFLIVFLVKKIGRPLLIKFVSPVIYKRFDNIVQKVGPVVLLIVYVLPFTPDDEITYIVAAGPLSFKRFLLPVVLGTAAKSAYSYIGELGGNGIVVALYARAVMLVVGLIVVGIQEYFIFINSKHSDASVRERILY